MLFEVTNNDSQQSLFIDSNGSIFVSDNEDDTSSIDTHTLRVWSQMALNCHDFIICDQVHKYLISMKTEYKLIEIVIMLAASDFHGARQAAKELV